MISQSIFPSNDYMGWDFFNCALIRASPYHRFCLEATKTKEFSALHRSGIRDCDYRSAFVHPSALPYRLSFRQRWGLGCQGLAQRKIAQNDPIRETGISSRFKTNVV